MKLLKKLDALNTFIVIGFINIIAVAAALFATNGQFLSEIVWDAKHDLFVDFTACEGDHLGQGSYGYYYIIGRLIPDGVIEDSEVSRWAELFWVIIVVLCVLILCYMIMEHLHLDLGKSVAFSTVFFLSAPFAFACIKAGNNVCVSLVLLLMALYLKDKDSKVAREAALIFIALAADLKLAPAIFVLFYLREKRFFETLRLAVYGLIFVVLPPIVTGGLSIYLSKLNSHSGLIQARPETIVGVVIEIAVLLGLELTTGLVLGQIAACLYLALCIFLFFKTEYSWKTLFLITSILIIFLNMTYPYTLCYLIIPILYFFRDYKNSTDRLNIIYAALFALIFTVYPFLRIDWPTATFITNYFFMYILVAVIIADLIAGMVKKKRMANNG